MTSYRGSLPVIPFSRHWDMLSSMFTPRKSSVVAVRSRLKLRGVRRLLVFFSELARKLQKRERQRRLPPNGRRDSGRDRRRRSLQERAEILLPLISAEERRAETVDISHSGATV